jgi:phosphoglycolate phosphatase-like HAD superfamily hydrolase
MTGGSAMIVCGYRCVLFDVDGTLVDSNAVHAACWSQAFARHGLLIPETQVRPLIGVGGDKLLPALAGVAHDSELGRGIAADHKRLFRDRVPTLQATRGAVSLVQALAARDVRLLTASSGDADDIAALLERIGVSSLIEIPGRPPGRRASKPDPDPIQVALACANASPADALMLGDTPHDIEAARRARVAIAALRCGGHWTDADLASADALFDDPADVEATIAAVARPAGMSGPSDVMIPTDPRAT